MSVDEHTERARAKYPPLVREATGPHRWPMLAAYAAAAMFTVWQLGPLAFRAVLAVSVVGTVWGCRAIDKAWDAVREEDRHG